MAILKDIFQKIFVSNKTGANYTNLNSAIADIGTIKTFRIDSAMTLTADITFPLGVTLIIGAQGSITGAYTLTGDNTGLVFEGFGNEIATNVIFAGTWLCENITPEHFGAVGDGVTDDRTALQKSFDFASLTKEKRIYANNTYKVSNFISVGNLTLFGQPTFIGTNGYNIFKALGSVGTWYAIDSNASINDYIIICSDATLLASLSPGDLLNIVSDHYGNDTNVVMGEIFEIASISGSNIYSRQPLHWDYTTEENAKIARIEPNTFSNVGQLKLTYPDISTSVQDMAFVLYYGKNNDLNISTFRTSCRALFLSSCYKPKIVFRGLLGELDGFGYGIAIHGPTMFADISGWAYGFRHCVTHGGLGNGIPWESHIHDMVGIGVYDTGGTIFDTHPSTGSAVFSNCRAFGTHGGTIPTGFSLNGKDIRVINCEAHDCFYALDSTDLVGSKIYVRNFRAINCNNGYMSTSDFIADELDIDGLTLYNDDVLTGYGLLLQGEAKRLSLNNVKCHNITGLLYLVGTTKYPSTVILSNFSHTNDTDNDAISIRISGSSVTTVIINGLINRNCGCAVSCENATSFILRNFTIENTSNENIIQLGQTQIIVDISNGLIRTPSTANTAIINLSEGAALLKLTDVIGDGANLDHITKVAAEKTFTNFLHCGNVFTNELVAVHETTSPATTVTSGSIGIT